MDPEEQEKQHAKDAALLDQFKDVIAEADAAQDQQDQQLAARQLATRTVSTPAQLADVLIAPGNRDAMIAAAHQKFGNEFVQQAIQLADARTAADQAASAALTKKYGLRPRRYAGMMDGTNAAELVFRQVIPQAVAFINEQAAKRKMVFRLTTAELATNFIAEGGNRVLDNGDLEGIDGFQSLGIDTFMDRYEQLKPWLHPSVQRDRVTAAQHTNEKNERVNSITDLTLVQAIYASAAMLAHSQAALEVDMRARGGFAGLSDRQETYLTTTYYNAGPGYGRNLLAGQGAAAANRRWTGSDDHAAHSRKPHFNATMRTSSWENVSQNVLANDQFRPVQAHGQIAEDARDEVGTNQGQLRARIAHIDEALAEIVPQRDSLLRQLPTVDPADKAEVQERIARLDSVITERTASRANLQELLDALTSGAEQLPAAPAAAESTP
jgi:hypothetical protein